MTELFEISVTKHLKTTTNALLTSRYFVLSSSKEKALEKIDINNAISILIKRICNKEEIIE